MHRKQFMRMLAVGVIGLFPWQHVMAQNALGNGNVLDNNLQAGSGGKNQVQQQQIFSARNNIVTGNVPGLGFFRDDVGYQATNEFGGNLGSADLFRFKATSFGSTLPAVSGGRSSFGASRSGVGLYRSFSSTGSNSLNQSQNVSSTGVASFQSGGLVIQSKAQGVGTHLFGLTVPQQKTLRAGLKGQATIGYVKQADGKILEISVSPLLGLRRRSPSQPSSRLLNSFTTTHQAQIDARVDQRVLGQSSANDGLDSSELGEEGQDPNSDGQSYQIDMMVKPRRMGDPMPTDNRQSVDTAPVRADPPTGPGSEGDKDSPLDQLSDQSVIGLYGGDYVSDTPTYEQIQEAARIARERARRVARGLPVGPDPSGVDENRLGVDQRSYGGQGEAERVQRLRLGTLAGAHDSRIYQLAILAEADLSARRYLDAEDRYEQVVRLDPENPLGHIGRIHAQIGSGMIESASLNLRTLLEGHPQMIAVRYEPKLLPDSKRLQWVHDKLLDRIGQTPRLEPALLLAYLGYQTGSAQWTQQALDAIQARWPSEQELMVRVRKIWLQKQAP